MSSKLQTFVELSPNLLEGLEFYDSTHEPEDLKLPIPNARRCVYRLSVEPVASRSLKQLQNIYIY